MQSISSSPSSGLFSALTMLFKPSSEKAIIESNLKENEILSYPQDVMNLIFANLSCIDLIRVQLTCKTWCVLGGQDYLWKKLMSDDVMTTSDQTYKKLFFQIFRVAITGTKNQLIKIITDCQDKTVKEYQTSIITDCQVKTVIEEYQKINSFFKIERIVQSKQTNFLKGDRIDHNPIMFLRSRIVKQLALPLNGLFQNDIKEWSRTKMNLLKIVTDSENMLKNSKTLIQQLNFAFPDLSTVGYSHLEFDDYQKGKFSIQLNE